ncbi:MAG: TonB family protein [Thermoanaerobaculia bacterium]
MLNIHRLDATRHAAFLAEQRKDPVTRKPFHAGDEIVVCAACGSAFSVDSWNFLDGQHDGQSDTLRDIAEGPVTLRGRRLRMVNRVAGATFTAPDHTAPPGHVPVNDPAGFNFRTPLAIVILLCILFWLVSLAVQPRAGSEQGVPVQVESETASRTPFEAVDQARQGKNERLARIAERARVEAGVVGVWADGLERLMITRNGSTFRAEYRFPTGTLRGEGHQTMRGELVRENVLRLTNIHHGKIANPSDYFSGDFDGVTWISLGADGTFVTARLDDGRSRVMTRITGDGGSDVMASAGGSAGQEQGSSEEPRIVEHVTDGESSDSPTEGRSIRQESHAAGADRAPRRRTMPERRPTSAGDDRRAEAGNDWRRRPARERQPRRVGGDVEPPVLITRTEPRYTEVARKARISGIVIVECIIDENGNVRDVRVLKPLPFGLDRAAADAVKQWKFRPGTLNGQPIEVVFNLTVTFKLN